MFGGHNVRTAPVGRVPVTAADPHPPLSTEPGTVYVTAEAAAQYRAAVADLGPEEARRELTALLALRGRITEERSDGRIYVRARARTEAVDVSATLTRDGPLLVVVHVSARETTRAPRRVVGARPKRGAT